MTSVFSTSVTPAAAGAPTMNRAVMFQGTSSVHRYLFPAPRQMERCSSSAFTYLRLIGPGKDVAIENRPYPTFVLQDGPQAGRKCPHGAIVKMIATCICGSDCHMVRGRCVAAVSTSL